VPLILGFTQDESFGGLGPVGGLSDYQAKARAAFGERADEFLALYPAASDQEARTQARAADRDATMVVAMDLWARAQVENGKAPVYSYMFARPHSYADGVIIANHDTATAGAYHTSEVPFWLGTLESFNRFRPMREWTAADRELSDAMVRSLIAFSRSGSPQTSALNWVPFDPDNPSLLELGRTVQAGDWPDQRKLEFFRELKSHPVQGGARD
jgi:para-nitrobenzyl esterase